VSRTRTSRRPRRRWATKHIQPKTSVTPAQDLAQTPSEFSVPLLPDTQDVHPAQSRYPVPGRGDHEHGVNPLHPASSPWAPTWVWVWNDVQLAQIQSLHRKRGKRRDMKISQGFASGIRPERLGGNASRNQFWNHRRLRPGLWSRPCWNNSSKEMFCHDKGVGAIGATTLANGPRFRGKTAVMDSGTSSELLGRCGNHARIAHGEAPTDPKAIRPRGPWSVGFHRRAVVVK